MQYKIVANRRHGFPSKNTLLTNSYSIDCGSHPNFDESAERRSRLETNLFTVYFQTHSRFSQLPPYMPSATVKSRRELSHRRLPDGKLLASNHRQFRCYCPLWPSQPKRKRGGRLVAVKQESIPGRVSWFGAVRSSTIRNTSPGLSHKGARAVAISIF